MDNIFINFLNYSFLIALIFTPICKFVMSAGSPWSFVKGFDKIDFLFLSIHFLIFSIFVFLGKEIFDYFGVYKKDEIIVLVFWILSSGAIFSNSLRKQGINYWLKERTLPSLLAVCFSAYEGVFLWIVLEIIELFI